MKTLKLFNAVVARQSKNGHIHISNDGYVIEADAVWAQNKIIAYYEAEKLDGNDLNKTFYKSWEKVQSSSRFELFLDQIRHYASTYGTGHTGEMYIPDDLLEVPDLKLTFKVIRAYTEEEMTEKCLGLLRSGIALTEETIDDVLSILTDELKYEFTGDEDVKNKEAVIKIADLHGVLPKDTMEFFRYIIYRTTNESLLIKNHMMIAAVKEGSYNPGAAFNKFGVERLAEIFNRFKPLFLAFKNKCPKTINKISKLSKSCHKPLVQNPLNSVTSQLLGFGDDHWLDNATPFALFKALSICYSRMNGQDTFLYRIRNGKSWAAEGKKQKRGKKNTTACSHNFDYLLNYVKNRLNLEGTTIFLPGDVDYALPTSEKMFVGNIPTGTKFFGDKLAVGMYWEDSWGARDLDLSGMAIDGGKVGWNARYNYVGLTYSGDITSAPNGAVEYLYATTEISSPTLVMNNVYSGDANAGYKIIVGRGDDVTLPYMMNPNNLFAEVKCESVEQQTILGMMLPGSFVLLNFGAGQARVSGSGIVQRTATKALFQQWNNPLTLESVLKMCGAKVVWLDSDVTLDEGDIGIDLSLDKLEKDTFVNLFTNIKTLV